MPRHLLISLTDPTVLSHCPFIMMTEVGSIFLDEAESAALRDYLLKGGFLWADDFWGNRAWDLFEAEIRKVLPSGPYPIVDLPLEHPIFHAQVRCAAFRRFRRSISGAVPAVRPRSAAPRAPPRTRAASSTSTVA